MEGRPLLHVYRPALITNLKEYVSIWQNECEKAGLEKPYIVATLTAGDFNPQDFGMDAGAERALYDWTNGYVKEINEYIEPYVELLGRVFSYEDIADYYERQVYHDKFDRFPSILPSWDNTARYQERAHILHGSTPERFQKWLETIIARVKIKLPSDRRFILINAWNEWAEGAYLEPDLRFGYAYLNSVGRALSNQLYTQPIKKQR